MLSDNELKELEIKLKKDQFNRDIDVTVKQLQHLISLLKEGKTINENYLMLTCNYLVQLCKQQNRILEGEGKKC